MEIAWQNGQITGISASTTIKVRRVIDGYLLDWNDLAFKSSAWSTPYSTLDEVDATNLPGTYRKIVTVTQWNDGDYQAFIGYAGSTDIVTFYIIDGANSSPGISALPDSHVTPGVAGSMFTMTVRKMLEASLRAIHVINPTESVNSGMASTAMEAMNMMLALWSTQGLIVPYTTRETFTLTSGTASYTWGTGGTFNSERPLAVMDDVFITSGGYDYPVSLIGEGEYNGISDKTTSGQPDKMWFKSDFTSYRGTVYLYPTPDAAYVLSVSSQKLFTAYTALTTTMSLSPEYFAAIKWNLAIELCPEYEKDPPQTVVVLAERSKDSIMALNAANRLEPIKINLGLASGGAGLSYADFMAGDF